MLGSQNVYYKIKILTKRNYVKICINTTCKKIYGIPKNSRYCRQSSQSAECIFWMTDLDKSFNGNLEHWKHFLASSSLSSHWSVPLFRVGVNVCRHLWQYIFSWFSFRGDTLFMVLKLKINIRLIKTPIIKNFIHLLLQDNNSFLGELIRSANSFNLFSNLWEIVFRVRGIATTFDWQQRQ